MKNIWVCILIIIASFSCKKNVESEIEGEWKIVDFQHSNYDRLADSHRERINIIEHKMKGGEAELVFLTNPNTIQFSGQLDTEVRDHYIFIDTTISDPRPSSVNFDNGFMVDEWEVVDEKTMNLSHILLDNNLYFTANYKLDGNRMELSFIYNRTPDRQVYWDEVRFLLERE